MDEYQDQTLLIKEQMLKQTKETGEYLKNILKDYNATIFNSIHEKKGEQFAVNAVIYLIVKSKMDKNISN